LTEEWRQQSLALADDFIQRSSSRVVAIGSASKLRNNLRVINKKSFIRKIKRTASSFDILRTSHASAAASLNNDLKLATILFKFPTNN